jgi:hypothetical protein
MAGQTSNYNFDYPTSTDYVKDGATAIQELADDVDATLFTALGGAYAGLRLIKKQTIGSAVSTVTVTGAFSATYDNYKILISGGTGSTGQTDLMLTLGSTTTGYYSARPYVVWGGTTTNITDNNAARWGAVGYSDTSGTQANFELCNPFITTKTVMSADVLYRAGGSAWCGGYLDNLLSYTAFTIAPAAGTLTGGTIYVYGYGTS